MRKYILLGVLALAFTAGVVSAGQEEEPDSIITESAEDELDIRVKALFGKSCATSTCHGGEHPKMDMSLEADDIPENLIDVPAVQNSEYMLIDTIDPSRSYLIIKITGGEGMKGKKMPIMLAPLTNVELTDVMTWVQRLAAAVEEKDVEDEDDDEDED